MSELSDETVVVLRRAGWHPGRAVDVSVYVADYKKVGYSDFEAAIHFLSEFGGLRLMFPNSHDLSLNTDCNFDVERAAMLGPEWFEHYAEHLGEEVVPIGQAHSNHMDLLMTSSGRVYACTEALLCYLGVDGMSALNLLCEGRKKDCENIPL
ncbi:SUKH-3 domain-containing protein [Alienimonas sp. DA493]|uniref:SUKH-3 domain-containing protein n=1 Tax=Alienimonas sp. DA493 TaxID=3373605 RepID=UPI003754B474